MNRHLTDGLVLVLGAAALVFAVAASSASEQLQSLDEMVAALPHHDIAGVVLGPEGKPLGRADIWLYYQPGSDNPRARIAGMAKTNRKGQFRFKQAVVWEPVLRDRMGSAPPRYAVIAHKGDVLGFQVVMEQDPLDGVMVQTHPTVGVRMRALDADNKPIAGVRVILAALQQPEDTAAALPFHERHISFSRELDAFSGITDAQGRVEIRALPKSGFYARKDGYAQGYIRGGGSVYLFPGASASGVVRIPDGAPAPGVAVRAYYTDHSNRLGWDEVVLSDAQGRFVFEHLPARGFRYSSAKPTEEEKEEDNISFSLTATDLRPGSPFIGKAEYMPINPGDRIEAELHLSRGVVLTGRVMDMTTQQPAVGFLFNLYTEGPNRGLDRVASVETDDAGRFTATIPPDTIVNAYLDSSSEQGTYILDESTAMEGSLLFRGIYQEDAVLKDFRVRLWPVQSLTGTVVDQTGRPVKAHVYIHGDVPRIVTNDAGEFTVLTAPTDRDFALYAETPERDQAGQLSLAAGAREAVITLAPTREYRGRVLNTDGLPAANLKFYADLDLNNSALYRVRETPTTDDQGEFQLAHGCPQAAYRVFWSSDNEENRDYHYGNARFDLAALPEDGVIQFEAPQYLNAILGQVTDAAGQPIAGAKIEIGWQRLARGYQSLTSDKAGEFTLPHLAPGTIELMVSAEGYKKQQVLSATDNYALRIALAPLSEPLRQYVRVLYPDGSPAAGVEVACMTSASDKTQSELLTVAFKTDRDGRAAVVFPTVATVSPSDLSNLVVRLPGYHIAGKRVFPDADFSIDIPLTPEDGLAWTFKATDEEGVPLSDAVARVTNIRQDSNDLQFARESPFAYPAAADGTITVTGFGRATTGGRIQAPGYVERRFWLQSERALDNLVFSLTTAASVTIRATAKSDGQALAGMALELTDVGWRRAIAAKETEPGVYVADQVEQGLYTVASADGENYLLSEPPMLTVEAGEHYETAIVLEEGVLVRGRVAFPVAEEKVDITTVRVVVAQEDRPQRRAKLEETGDWSLYLLPGKYTLTASAPGWEEVRRDIEVEASSESAEWMLDFTSKTPTPASP